MNADSSTILLEESFNKTIQVLKIQLEHFVDSAVQAASIIYIELAKLTHNWQGPIEFTQLQWTLIKVFLGLLLSTGFLILYCWRIYGEVITEKFIRPSTLKEIEELKLSVAKLKLPKEHSPRI